MVVLCWNISFLLWISACIVFVAMLLWGFGRKLPVSPLKVLTIGTAAAVVLLHWPAYFTEWKFVVHSGLLTAFHSFRFFSMSFDYDKFVEIAAANFVDSTAYFWVTLYLTVLRIFAPALTITAVLSVFSDLMDKLQFAASGNRTLYIFSELNSNSLALAADIAKKPEKKLIVFSDFSESLKKEKQDLFDRARDLGAICLKQEITQLQIKNKKTTIEFFLVSEAERINLEYAVALTEKHKNSSKLADSQKICIYLYSSSPAAQAIIDSLDKGPYLLNEAYLKTLNSTNIPNLRDKKVRQEMREKIPGNFSIRCVDPIKECVMEILTEDVSTVFSARDKVIRIAVVGYGTFGRQAVKNAVWLYQMQGYRVQLYVFDKDPGLRKRFAQECPELVSRSDIYEPGEAQYSILFSDADCFTSDFDQACQKLPGFQNVQLVFVSLGDDNTNISAALLFRAMFNRLRKEDSATEPKIYAVVRDDQLEQVLHSGKDAQGKNITSDAWLLSPRGVSTHITLIGTHSNQYSYEICEKLKKQEYLGLQIHMGWVKAVSNGLASKADQNKLDKQAENIQKYFKYSYFRDASISRGQQELMLRELKKAMKNLDYDQKITEHMRWNAHMRSMGYRYDPVLNHSAKLHSDLIPWHQLSEEEKTKDDSILLEEDE